MQRTNTTRSAVLKVQDMAYDFTNEDHRIVRITIPTESTSIFPVHWHKNQLGCVSIEGIQGRMHLHKGYDSGSLDLLGAGIERKFKPGTRVYWGRAHPEGPPLIAFLLVANTNLHRNICSAALDADIFPHLATTPFWVRLLARSPRVVKFLVPRLLWIQLRCTYFAHDFHLGHGTIPFTSLWAWPFDAPPSWLNRLELWSLYVISYIVMSSCYWAGTLFLGMRAAYPEYTKESIPAKWT